jgi:hypothetical protein
LKRLSNHDPLYELVNLSGGWGNRLGGNIEEAAKSGFPNDMDDMEYPSLQSRNTQSTGLPPVPTADTFPTQYARILPPLAYIPSALTEPPLGIVPRTIKHPFNSPSSGSEFSYVQRYPLKAANPLYSQLSFQKAEIRLLTFTSQQTDMALQCTLTTVPLPKSPPYVALSYMWGDPTNTVPILVNHLEVQVTVNLRNALLRLHGDGIAHIWADALCINQADSEERTAQVGRMGTIFRKASQVAVWLGREAKILEQALQIYNTRSLSDDVHLLIGPFVRELISQPYWKRVWIIQEIAVASHISVYCGEYKIGWVQFVDMCSLGAGDNTPSTNNSPDDGTVSGFTTLLELRKDTLARKPIKFLDALHRSRSSLSTDPRDKLYALLGLSYDGRHFIPEPNYMNSVTESFTDFATALIEGGELLDFIYLRSATRKNDGRLPSWVPDWTDLDNSVARRQLDQIMSRSSLTIGNSESPHVHKQAEIDGSKNELTIKGEIIDTVGRLGGLPTSNYGSTTADTTTESEEPRLSDTAFGTSDLLYRSMIQYRDPRAAKSKQILKLAVINTIPQALLPQFNNWVLENHSFLAFREPLKGGTFARNYHQSVIGGLPEFVSFLLMCMQLGMRLIRPQEVVFGGVHPMAQKGDKIARVLGCSEYVVLRASEAGEGYQVIGAAHMFGIDVVHKGDSEDDEVQRLKLL